MTQTSHQQVLTIFAEMRENNCDNGPWMFMGSDFYKPLDFDPAVAARLGLIEVEGIVPLEDPRGLPVGDNKVSDEVFHRFYGEDPTRSPFETDTTYFLLWELEREDSSQFTNSTGEICFSVHAMCRLREKAQGNLRNVRIIAWLSDVTESVQDGQQSKSLLSAP
jgi:hypothetical protein